MNKLGTVWHYHHVLSSRRTFWSVRMRKWRVKEYWRAPSGVKTVINTLAGIPPTNNWGLVFGQEYENRSLVRCSDKLRLRFSLSEPTTTHFHTRGLIYSACLTARECKSADYLDASSAHVRSCTPHVLSYRAPPVSQQKPICSHLSRP